MGGSGKSKSGATSPAGVTLKMELVNMGFVTRFQSFCSAIGWGLVELEADDYDEAGLSLMDVREQVIVGLKFLDFTAGEKGRTNAKFYALEALAVFMHVAALLLLPAIVLALAMQVQYMYAETMATDDALTWIDLTRWPLELDGEVILIVRVTALFCVIFMGLASLRIIAHYAAPDSGVIRLAIQKSFAVILLITVFAIIAYLTTVACWFLLAAILDARRFLPYGVAVATVGLVTIVTWKQLVKTAKEANKRLRATLDNRLQEKLVLAKGRLEQELADQRKRDAVAVSGMDGPSLRRRRNAKNTNGTTKGGGGGGGDAEGGAQEDDAGGAAGGEGGAEVAEEKATKKEEQKQKEKEKEKGNVSIGEIFDLLNADEDEGLDYEEFSSLFERLDLKLPRRRREQMFAYCDADSSGTISRDEFESAWEWVKEQMVEEAVESMGISNADIVIAITTLVLGLTLVIIFILVALKAWENASSFDSVIQSLLVASTGGVMQKFRKQRKGENAEPEELDGVLDSISNEASSVETMLTTT